jgi:hypothetical protein
VVPTATSSLHQRRQIDQTRSGLGKIGSGVLSGTARSTQVLRVVETAATAPATLPLGAQTRKLDPEGRLKLAGDGRIGTLLGWQDGGLDVVMSAGWAVVRQPSCHVGYRPKRYSSLASFVVSGSCERIGFKPAHLSQLGVTGGSHVLVAPIPDTGTLLVVDPSVCLIGAPDLVSKALEPQPRS